MSAENWYFAVGFVLACAMWFCGSGAACSRSPIMSALGFSTAFAAGFTCAMNNAVGPVSASIFMASVFVIGFLVGRGERRRTL